MGDADCDCDCDCNDDCGDCDDCTCHCDDCCQGCICDFDECMKCQNCCSTNGDEGCGRECTKNDFDCSRRSYCDNVCCIFYDDIYYYGYYDNNQESVNHAQQRGYNQQRTAPGERKPPQDLRSKGRENQRLRRLVKCFLPCGKPFWKILFLLAPFYILFSPILVPVFLVYTCICGCRVCVGLKPSQSGTTNHVTQEAGPLPQVMYRGSDRQNYLEQATAILVTYPRPQHSQTHRNETLPPNENEPQVISSTNTHPIQPPIQNNDQKVPPPISRENGEEPKVPPPPYSAMVTEEIHFTDLASISNMKNIQQNVK